MMRGAAIVLSLFAPGSGQLLLGRTVRGIVLAAIALSLLLLVALAGAWPMYLWLVLHLVAVLELCYGPSSERGHALGASLAGGGQVLGFVLLRVIAFEGFKVASPSMEPTLKSGDYVIVNKLAPRLGAIGRGDIVVFTDPCGSGAAWVKRVVAVGGDSVELRCGIVYVNGIELPQESLGAYSYDEPGPTKTDRVRAARYREGDHEILEDEQRPSLDAARATATDYLEVADAHDFPPLDGEVAPASGCAAPSLAFDRTTDRPARACDPQLHYTVPAGDVFVLGDNRVESIDSRNWGGFPSALVRGLYVSTLWNTP
jgi:signal peptidase I